MNQCTCGQEKFSFNGTHLCPKCDKAQICKIAKDMADNAVKGVKKA